MFHSDGDSDPTSWESHQIGNLVGVTEPLLSPVAQRVPCIQKGINPFCLLPSALCLSSIKVKISDLTQIIAQASCLSERLGKHLQVTDSEQQLTSRLHRWCEVSAHGNWQKFQKRLLWDGLGVEQVQQVLRPLPVVDD